MTNIALVYDTETTGLPLFREPSEHHDQPHIVQLAAHLVDLNSRAIIQTMDVIIKPEGWEIPEEVSKIHGITTEHAMAVGIPEKLAIEMFLAMWAGRKRIAHNEQFDARILRIATKRYCDESVQEAWKAGESECTATMSTPICALPPTDKMKAAGRFHNKTPNLSEAYKHFTGKNLENAHTAIADVNACLEVYLAIKDMREKAA